MDQALDEAVDARLRARDPEARTADGLSGAVGGAVGGGAPGAGRERLRGLQTRRRLTGAQAEARSRIVRRLRIALPLLAFLLIAAFLFNAGNNSPQDVDLKELQAIDADAEELRMANPRFSGVGQDGAPYDITADAAIQTPGNDDVVRLEQPRAVTTGDDERSTLTARDGSYQSDENRLTLTNDVTYEHYDGEDTYVLRTSAAVFTVDDERVVSQAPVEGEGPRGARLSADRLVADNQSGSVVLEGNVRVRFFPEQTNLTSAGCRDGATERAQPAASNNGAPALREPASQVDDCQVAANTDKEGTP